MKTMLLFFFCFFLFFFFFFQLFLRAEVHSQVFICILKLHKLLLLHTNINCKEVVNYILFWSLQKLRMLLMLSMEDGLVAGLLKLRVMTS